MAQRNPTINQGKDREDQVRTGAEPPRRQDSQAKLERHGSFLQAVLDHIEDGIVACDAEGTLTVFNRATTELHGLPQDPLPPERWAEHYDLYMPDGHTRMRKEDVPLFRALRGERVRDAQLVIAPKDGRRRVLVARGQPIVDREGNTLGAVVAMHDITERKRAEDQLAHQALHDPLTGLPNRTLLVDRLGHALQLVNRLPTTLAVLLVDVDNFKRIKDRLGHQAGDRLLIALATRLRRIVRASDTASRPAGERAARPEGETVARLAGDAFVLLCEGIGSEHDAITIAERVRSELLPPFVIDGNRLTVTASIGVALPSDPQPTAEELIRDAEVAMHGAKERGGNDHQLFEDSMRERVFERLRVENELGGAIERDELRLHYQPIVSLADGAIVGVEALIRWQHPERGLLSPAKFIPYAEESGLIVPVGRWVIEEAARQCARWRETNPDWPPFAISANVSARQCTPELLDIVAGADIDPKRLILEITESLFLHNPDAPELLQALTAMGVRLALDDFGTGYSSLNYLTRFSLDSLKLDRSFVSEVETRSEVRKIVIATIGMARELEMGVVAEGVETAAQLECLRALNCPLAQGHLFAKPQAADTTTKLLANSFGAPGNSPALEG